MIELINDDYADFVHLSSNLVSLQSAIDKIDNDINTIWTEFENSTNAAVCTAERVEFFCVQLSENRSCQIEVRHRISFLSALQRLADLLTNMPSSLSILWLEKVSSCLVDISSYKEKQVEESRESKIFNKLLHQVETVLCNEGVRSAGEDCATLPCVLSLLSLANCTHSLTARLVSDLIYPKLVQPAKDHYEMLKSVFAGVNKVGLFYLELLGIGFFFGCKVSEFTTTALICLDAFQLERCSWSKSMGTVAVPTNTSLFHRCFMATQEFIENWPVHSHSRAMLKAVRDKFNLVVYYKLVTHKLVRQVDSEMAPESFQLVPDDQFLKRGVLCGFSSTILRTIETVWAEDVFLYPIIDKLWDLTLRLLNKHLAWARALLEAATTGGSSDLGSTEAWHALLAVRHDLFTVHSKCLTRFGTLIDSESFKIDEAVIKLVSASVSKEFDAVSDVPKQYRWTKKPSPLTHSAYISVAHKKLDVFTQELSKTSHPTAVQLSRLVLASSYRQLVEKAEKVLDSVDATGSSLSRFKRKGPVLDGTTDDDKIRTQVL
uniref:Conserved oligomeric Golgi complex subunit 2 n=1 Tax=Angiostrongylus cantonensis TaxID=6313 RepID=A0A0K0DFR6_ANGCA